MAAVMATFVGIAAALHGGRGALGLPGFIRTAVPRSRVVVACASASSLKTDLQSAIGLDGLGAVPSLDRQTELNEAILRLSSINPTAEPARSSLLNGKWEVIYSAAPGSGFTDSPTRLLALALYAAPLSPSVLAQQLARLPFSAATLGALLVTIVSPEAGQPRVSVDTSLALLGGTPQPIVLRANLLARSGVALREDFLEVEAFGQKSLLPGPFALSRSLLVAYLDDELLIVRDDGGLPSVLRRATKFPSAPEEPSYGDDDDAPGAG